MNPKQNTTPAFVWSEMTIGSPAVAVPTGEMVKRLFRAEEALPTLLLDPEKWSTLDVTYHPPRVERVYAQFEDMRVALHCIHPCSREEALYHPHPWASAMRIVSGIYEMGTAVGSGEITPPDATLSYYSPGSVYEMPNPDAWHFVRPVGGVVYSIMVTLKPWNRSTPKSFEALKSLTPERKMEMIEIFRAVDFSKWYPYSDVFRAANV